MVFGGREQSLLSGEKSGRVPEIENSNASKATQELTQSIFGARNQNHAVQTLHTRLLFEGSVMSPDVGKFGFGPNEHQMDPK